jgi:hypothetical protein
VSALSIVLPVFTSLKIRWAGRSIGKILFILISLPDRYVFSDYHRGDVYSRLSSMEMKKKFPARSAWPLPPLYMNCKRDNQEITVSVPLTKTKIEKNMGIINMPNRHGRKAFKGCAYYKYLMSIFSSLPSCYPHHDFAFSQGSLSRAIYLPAVLVS